jgi:hypothetical protein
LDDSSPLLPVWKKKVFGAVLYFKELDPKKQLNLGRYDAISFEGRL